MTSKYHTSSEVVKPRVFAQAASFAYTHKHALVLALAGLLLSGAALSFNYKHGYSEGGVASGLALLAFGLAKDSGLSLAASHIGRGRVLAFLAGTIGMIISIYAALQATSGNKQAASDPKAAIIAAFDTATKQAKELEGQIAALGQIPSKADAEAALALVVVDGSIFKRTKGCSALEHPSASIQVVNRQTCQPYALAKTKIDKASEAGILRAKLEEARATISKGKPASADAGSANIARLLKLDGIDTVQAMGSLLIALAIEIGAPIAWAAFARTVSEPKTRPVEVQPVVERRPVQTRIQAELVEPMDETVELRRNSPSPSPNAMSKRDAEMDLVTLLALNRSVPSQDTLAERWQVSKSTASYWLEDWEDKGLIQRTRVGRCHLIEAKALA